jgi:FkbM family methyltransferase
MANVRENLLNMLIMCRERLGIVGPLAHVGAHDGEEVPLYRKAGLSWDQIHLIDPLPDKCAALRVKYPRAAVHECACSNKEYNTIFNVGGKTNQSSLNRHEDDNVVGQIRVDVRRLTTLVPDAVIVSIDVQGHEKEVMEAMPSGVRLCFVETSPFHDESMASQYDEVMELATRLGFTKIAEWTRDYRWLYKWCRGKEAPQGREGLVKDLVLVRK